MALESSWIFAFIFVTDSKRAHIRAPCADVSDSADWSDSAVLTEGELSDSDVSLLLAVSDLSLAWPSS